MLLQSLRTAARFYPRTHSPPRIFSHFTRNRFSTMGDTTQPPSRTDSPASRASTPRGGNSAKPKKPVRILMLHGYTQSGPLFRAKTRALEKLLAKALAPIGLVPEMLYPTAPNRLSARDIPGYEPRGSAMSEEGGEAEGDGQDEIDSWAWFRKEEATGGYRFVEEGMGRLAEAMREGRVAAASAAAAKEDGAAEGAGGGEDDGAIDGVVGFSQGGCVAAMLASAMEEGRGEAAPAEHAGWARAVREANGGRALKFAVVYSGFYAVPQDLAWLYEPRIKTPTLHFLGSLDTVVDESRSQGLVERCEEPLVVTHPGGHYVPVNKEWVMPVAGFINKCLEGPDGTKL